MGLRWPLIVKCLWTVACVGAWNLGSARDVTIDLTITGTSIAYNAAKLPERLEGVVFVGGVGDGRKPAGTYKETIKAEIDPELGLVGARGRSVLRFEIRDGGRLLTEEIVSDNLSRVVGESLSTAELLIESTGTVVNEPASYGGLKGLLRSRSRVRLGEKFSLHVEVRVVFSEDDVEPADDFLRGVPRGRSMLVDVDGEGKAVIRYSPAFKRSMLRRMTGAVAIEPAVLAKETGVAQAVLSRWGTDAKAVAMVQGFGKLFGALKRPKRSFSEKLGVVLRAAVYSEEELEAYLADAGVKRNQYDKWRQAMLRALEEETQQKKSEGSLERLKKRVDELLKEPSPDVRDPKRKG